MRAFIRRLAPRRKAVASVVAALAVLLAACTTPYQPRGAGGGYTDQKVTDNSYVVSFFGNGNTSRETVWMYWIHRCAELTVEKGFSYFTVAPKSVSWLEDGRNRTASVDLPLVNEGAWRWVPLRGGGGGGGYRAPTYIYVPGGTRTITTWSSSGTVLMFRGLEESGARFSLDARKVMAALQPVLQSQGRAGALTPAELLSRTMANPAALADLQPAWSGGSNGRVEMDDLKELLPQ